MIGIDTNVLVRYFTQDDPHQSPIATRFVEGVLAPNNAGLVTLVALVELVWVLQSRYGASRDELIETLQTILTDPRFYIQQADAVWLAFDHFDLVEGIDFADALIAALGQTLGASYTVTFDQKALRIEDMRAL